MKDFGLVAIIVLIFVGLIGLGIWWDVYKYGDCRKVGHSKLYCIMDIGK